MVDKYKRIYSYIISVYDINNNFIENITIESKLSEENNVFNTFENFIKNNYNLNNSDFEYYTKLFKKDAAIQSCIAGIIIFNMKKYNQDKRIYKLKKVLND